MEARLAALGYQPNARDSLARWEAERARASRLGKRALILVGASRIQLGVDLDVLRKETGLEPVQLALDASAGAPILEGLAKDPSISGTILYDYYDHAIGGRGGAAERARRAYEMPGSKSDFFDQPSKAIENILTAWLKERLRTFADGANPLNSLTTRIMSGLVARQYLVTRPDRSRLADYSRVDMPYGYYYRTARTMGVENEVDLRAPDIKAELERRIAALLPRDNAVVRKEALVFAEMASAIRSRGGQLILVVMPTSGMVREIESRRYPKELFWDRFIETSGVTGIHSRHEPELRDFKCPDGSHLDVRDRARFTRELIKILRRKGLRTYP